MEEIKYKPNSEEVDESRRAVLTAYSSLSEGRKAIVDDFVDDLTAAVKTRVPTLQVGENTALEIIGKLGIWFAKMTDEEFGTLR